MKRMMSSVGLAVLAASVLGAAASVADEPKPSIITRPDWAEKPSGEDLAAFYPERAMREGVSGRVTLACTVTAEGLLADCTTSDETPAGYGFDQAALGLSAKFRMKPRTQDGQPVDGGRVVIPIILNAPPPNSMDARPGQIITRPDWKRRPTAADLKRVYPPRAKAEHVEGRVRLKCDVSLEGRLVRCQTSEETPEGYGFGEAAIQLADVMRMTPVKVDGKPSEGGTINMPIVFRPDF